VLLFLGFTKSGICFRVFFTVFFIILNPVHMIEHLELDIYKQYHVEKTNGLMCTQHVHFMWSFANYLISFI
jgi:hypothetical protein